MQHPPSVRPVMRTRRPPKTCSTKSWNVSSAVPVGAPSPLHDNGAVAHRHVRRLPERGTNVGWSALRSRIALFLFGAGPRPSQQPGYAERPASHPVIDVVFVLQPDPSLTYSVFSVLSFTRFPAPLLACNLSFSQPPFSVFVFQHPQRALRDVVRLDGRAMLAPVAKLHRQMGRIDHFRIGRANGDYVVPEWWRSHAFALTMIIDKFECCL